MIADASLNIVYMNPSVIALMREAEQDLKTELPRFSVASLIGSNIDIFHKNPNHQRAMLLVMDKVHSATIVVGQRTFDLIVTPLFEDGKRTGYVVEWSDARARLQNIDYAGKFLAINRTQAVIEFSVTGEIQDANPLFLEALGYTIEEIKGRHHSIFVDPAHKDSREYSEFWRSLGQGEFHAGQFRRIGKGGRIVWIEGAYNPILDAKGNVTKIVKFANDVTRQVSLLGNLKTLIDENFGEIAEALGQSEAESASAFGAADETLSSVETVATGTEQLSSSISEISRSMAKSRSDADHAYAQSVNVAESTVKLTGAALAMNGIVDLIRNVAGQINLLALNATIEAARAGDAGKGFAVVATEVKNLANQSAKATEQISKEIESIQATSSDVAHAIETIRTLVEGVRENVTATAGAVEEQNAVTGSISNDMKRASFSVSAVTKNVQAISSAVARVTQAVDKTKQAASVLVK